MLASTTSIVFSQTIDPATYNGSYKVKVGDTARYDYTKVLFNGENYQPITLILPNGPTDSYNLTTGVSLYITVSQINESSSNFNQIIVNQSMSIPGRKPITSNSIPHAGFIFPGFDSYSHAESYYKAISNSTNYSFSRSGAIINVLTSSSYNISPSLLSTIFYQYSYNWKTGWLQKRESKNILSNGTIANEIVLQRHSDNLFSTIMTYTTSLFEIGSFFIIIAVVVLVVLSYNSYSKIPKTSDHSQSFSQYLRNRFHYTKKNTTKKSAHSPDKALETIESILKETTNDSK